MLDARIDCDASRFPSDIATDRASKLLALYISYEQNLHFRKRIRGNMISDVFDSVSVVEFSNYPVIRDRKIFLSCTNEQIRNEPHHEKTSGVLYCRSTIKRFAAM